MSSARYLLSGSAGPDVVEDVTGGPDGGGERLVAVRTDPLTGVARGRLELHLDAAGVTRRLHAEAGAWVLRGGCVGDHVLWRRGPDEHEAVANGFWGTSPAYALAVLRRLALAVGEVRRVRLVEVSEPVLATRLVTQSWARTALDRWAVHDLDTAEQRELQVVDGLVVAGTGLTLTRA